MRPHWWYYGAATSLIALIFLCLGWELYLAPLRQGGSLLVLKATILLLPLHGILSRRLYTYQWSCMLILAFFAEGVMRGWSDRGLAQQLAWIEILLSGLFFLCVLGFFRATRYKSHPS